ncbi:MAG TPA: PAS domain S-box protein [Fimbriiglobus sp.]|jgi:PAS domain S-box-containing protein
MPNSSSVLPDRIAPERLAEILDIAEDGIVTVNARHEIVVFNRGATKIFGYDPAEVLGRSLNVLIPPAFLAAHPAYVSEFARSADVSRLMNQRKPVFGRRKDGTEFPAEITISKLGHGTETLFTAIVRDITERKRYEETILELNQELENRVTARTRELAERNLQLAQKNEENEMFVYSVSHDLRSPLVNLEGFGEELTVSARDLRKLVTAAEVPASIRSAAEKLIDEGMAESIQFIRTAVGRLSRIIDALLRLSRAGRVVYQHGPVDVSAVVARVVAALRHTTEEKKAVVTVGELPPACADAGAVEQVFANLIGNALNYLDSARPGRVEVEGRVDPTTGPTYVVRDNGIGIPDVYLSKLFHVFQRIHPYHAPGEGIGLAIVRRVLERLGGSIRVESAEGVGSAFTLTLPTVPAEAV